MPYGICTPIQPPSPSAAFRPAEVINYDNHGSVWGTDTAQATEESLAEERAAGTHIDEWNTVDRDGQPLRVVRCSDPEFLDTICVFTSSRPEAAA
ncbi:hypothetical protein ACIGZH_01780 [Streptomyces sp. NPDC058319]|uniref:hypothetical protein n=1 Tax=unclassified Streptomyces TaxID=2593676 RepID=UPI0036EFA6A5